MWAHSVKLTGDFKGADNPLIVPPLSPRVLKPFKSLFRVVMLKVYSVDGRLRNVFVIDSSYFVTNNKM